MNETIANSRRKYWYISNNKAVTWALNKERMINSGFYDLTTAYQSVHVNYWNLRVPNGTHGGVRGGELITPSYSSIFWWRAVKIYVEFYSVLCIIKVTETIWNQRKELKEYGKNFTSIWFEKL